MLRPVRDRAVVFGGFAMRIKWFAAMPLACVLMAAQAAEVKSGAKAAAEAAPDDVICTYETPVGSHVKKRICVTKAERDRRTEQDRDTMRNVQNRGNRTGNQGR